MSNSVRYPGLDAVKWVDPVEGADADVAVLTEDFADTPIDHERLVPSSFAEWFVVAQTAIPAFLFLPGSQAIRLPLRVGAYAMAIFGFVLWWLFRGARRSVHHPAERWLLLVVLYLVVMIFHPLTNGLQAGVAQTLLYFAVFCAVFWTPAFVDRPRQLVRILAILLVCNGLNSVVGVLQVYDPERWMPRELSFVFTQNRFALATVSYMGPDGRLIVRPPGLFDTPGAVCGPGSVAALLGLIFVLEPFAWWKRLIALAFSFAGISAIYLSHVRASFVVTIGMMVVYGCILAVQGQRRRLTAFAALCAAIIALGLTASVVLGGESIQERFSTLLADDPRSLYYNSRGQQLEAGFNELLVEYPFGAGLARWGMMRNYFGDPSNLDSTELWAEVQPNAWMLDGGLFLLALYGLALVVTAVYEWRLVRALQRPQDRSWAAVVAALNIGTLALVFSFVPFTTQVGLQFWFLTGALHGAMARELHAR